MVFVLFVLGILPLGGQQAPVMSTYAGTHTVFDGDTKPALQAPIGPEGDVEVDSNGNVYVSDPSNCMVHVIDRGAILRTIAGTGVCNGDSAYRNVSGRTTPMFAPYGLAVDRRRNVYISAGSAVVQWNLGGFLNRVAGVGYGTDPDGTLANAARLTYPGKGRFDEQGNFYFREENKIRRIRVDNGRLETVAGNGVAGFSGDNGNALNASLDMGECGHLAFDSQGNLLICDQKNGRLRKVDGRTKIITTLAGSDRGWDWGPGPGDGGPATDAAIWPSAMTIDDKDNIYIGEPGRIRLVTPSGLISTYAGNGGIGTGLDNGPALSGRIELPRGLAVDSEGNLYIRSKDAYLRRVTRNGQINIVAGNGNFKFGGDGGPASFANLNNPTHIAYDRNSGALYIGDTGGRRVRKVDAVGNISTIAGTGREESSYESGVPATGYPLSNVSGVAVDAIGRVYISQNNQCGIWRIETNGIMTALGGFREYGCPRALASGPDGTIYVLVGEHPSIPNSVWRFQPNGEILHIAGNGNTGFSGDGPALTSAIDGPSGLAVDSAGRVYISDSGNSRIRRIEASGILTTYAGNGKAELSGDNGPASSSGISGPAGLVFDAAGNLYVADYGNARVRVISSSGVITTYAGTIPYGCCGDAEPPTSAGLTFPTSLAIDDSGNLLVTDTGNGLVRVVLSNQPAFDLVRTGGGARSTEQVSVLTFSAIQGQTTGQLSGSFLIKSSVGGLTYSVEADSGAADWLSFTPAQGAINGLTNVTATANPAGRSAGTFEGYLVVTVGSARPQQRRIRVVLTVLPEADLSISGSMSGSGEPAPAGSVVTLTYGITNNGQTVSNNVQITTAMPPGLTLVSCVVQGGQCAAGTATGGLASCPNCPSAHVDDMPGGATVQMVVTATVNTAMNGVAVRSDVTADTSDTNRANNSAIAVGSPKIPPN